MTSRINHPDLWLDRFPRPGGGGHKYHRGQVLVLGSDQMTGATRLASEAASRIGAGLVTVAAPEGRGDLYRVILAPDLMVTESPKAAADYTAVLAGPGGLPQALRPLAEAAMASTLTVLDAEAIGGLKAAPTPQNTIITPHEGEFARHFPDLTGPRETRAQAAADRHGITCILKGAETLIAAPGHVPVLNTHASPYLAKAGTGDVLAGLLTGLAAQGMPAFEASCAAVWIHGEAARRCGPGLLPQDLTAQIPDLLKDLLAP